jgi:ribosome-associated heat shock protein Hsp15
MTSPNCSPAPDGATGRARLDRWLWAARFFKTRALAKAAIEGGRVLILPAGAAARAPGGADGRGVKPKPSREVGAGEALLIRRGDVAQTIVIRAVDERRGSAAVAARLYDETPESVEAREIARARRQLERAGLQVPAARPDRRDRRERMRLKLGDDGPGPADHDPAIEHDSGFDEEQP